MTINWWKESKKALHGSVPQKELSCWDAVRIARIFEVTWELFLKQAEVGWGFFSFSGQEMKWAETRKFSREKLCVTKSQFIKNQVRTTIVRVIAHCCPWPVLPNLHEVFWQQTFVKSYKVRCALQARQDHAPCLPWLCCHISPWTHLPFVSITTTEGHTQHHTDLDRAGTLFPLTTRFPVCISMVATAATTSAMLLFSETVYADSTKDSWMPPPRKGLACKSPP